MSISGITGTLASIESLLTSTSTTATTATTNVASTTSTTSSTQDSTTTKLDKETAQLLKDLVSGDLASAKKDVAQLQKLLKSQDSSSSSATSSSSSSFTGLLSSISKALDSGSTSDALNTLATYLVGSSTSSGNLVNVSA